MNILPFGVPSVYTPNGVSKEQKSDPQGNVRQTLLHSKATAQACWQMTAWLGALSCAGIMSPSGVSSVACAWNMRISQAKIRGCMRLAF